MSVITVANNGSFSRGVTPLVVKHRTMTSKHKNPPRWDYYA